ncbi:DUF6961 family protein [Aurantiacibacter sp. D1-12]|uniref:DUF6961 family protein n=1 Tax=Aurantiacibacter sp. D1-12 TaxID=2993658 RepID=UPI00237CD609|nr:hypothetical protein [Aurantiacibacter sp. D1-12]MDE1467933.1 hypothetical protein [Aurantiacibacter sp. D1-12]
MTRDQELWGVALWVEKNHGGDGHEFIAGRVSTLKARGDESGAAYWETVEERFSALRTGPICVYGQPETWPN